MSYRGHDVEEKNILKSLKLYLIRGLGFDIDIPWHHVQLLPLVLPPEQCQNQLLHLTVEDITIRE